LRAVADQVDALELTTQLGLQQLQLEIKHNNRLQGPLMIILTSLVLISLVISMATFVLGNANRALIYEIERTRTEQKAPADTVQNSQY